MSRFYKKNSRFCIIEIYTVYYSTAHLFHTLNDAIRTHVFTITIKKKCMEEKLTYQKMKLKGHLSIKLNRYKFLMFHKFTDEFNTKENVSFVSF